MAALIVMVAFWIGSHLGLAYPPVRQALVRRGGETGFRILYSAVSVLAIWLLVRAWRAAPMLVLWRPPLLAWPVFLLLMLAACFLFVGAVTRPNPTMAGPPMPASYTVAGMQRVTRHPMLWAFTLWALVHMLANGDVGSELFFGSFLVVALAGMGGIDAKLRRRNPELAQSLARGTSLLPFGAILAGRNRFVASELGLRVWLGGTMLFVLLLSLHRFVIGVSPVP